jgi:hypothetical protein
MEPTTNTANDRAISRTGLLGLMAVQAFVGYEWLMSGLAKLWRGGFASGLAAELTDKSEGVSGWYRRLLDNVIIPHAWFVGWVVLIGELAIGLSLVGGALAYARRSAHHPSQFPSQVVLAVAAIAALAATLLNVAFHLANASPHPWIIPSDGFDEGVDLDSLLPMVQLVLVAVSVRLFTIARVDRRSSATTMNQADGFQQPHSAA